MKKIEKWVLTKSEKDILTNQIENLKQFCHSYSGCDECPLEGDHLRECDCPNGHFREVLLEILNKYETE